MQPPRLVVNAKAYAEVLTAPGALRLVDACARAAAETGHDVGLALPATLLGQACAAQPRRVAILAQHADPHPPGAATGWLPVEALAAAGARGSLLNHAEHKRAADVPVTVGRLREAGLWSLVCADSQAELRSLAAAQPTYLAIEPPQLIGGDVSVTTADPGIVSDAAKDVARLSERTHALCGAGVKTGRDVAKAVDLGAYGVLLASGVVKAADPHAVLVDLLRNLP